MTVPAVTISTIDGGLGIGAASSNRPYVYIGYATQGATDTPQLNARAADVISTFGNKGPMVEAACYAIERFGATVGVVRCACSVAGSCSTIDVTGVAGTSVVSIAESPAPTDNYDLWVKAVTGGTRGTPGITYRYSLDGGRNWSAIVALGTDTSITVEGVQFDLAAGTLVANDIWKTRTTAPTPNASDLTATIAALKAWLVDYEAVVATFAVDATIATALEGLCTSMVSQGKFKHLVLSWRPPTATETDAQYQTAFQTFRGTWSSIWAEMVAGNAWVVSSNPGRAYTYLRSPVWAIAAKEASVSAETNIAQRLLPGGPLPGVFLTDTNGNPIGHDEMNTPGLDDMGATVLRTWPKLSGAYVNQHRAFGASGSDFVLTPYRRVFNAIGERIYAYFADRLNSDVLVDASTGYILESEAVDLESGAERIINDEFTDRRKVSGARVTVSRTDNILGGAPMTVDVRIVPLGYKTAINVTMAFTARLARSA